MLWEGNIVGNRGQPLGSESQTYCLQGMQFYLQALSLEEERSSGWGYSAGWHLMQLGETLGRKLSQPVPRLLTHGNCEIINMHCFKLINLWQCVTQQEITNSLQFIFCLHRSAEPAPVKVCNVLQFVLQLQVISLSLFESIFGWQFCFLKFSPFQILFFFE